MAADSTAAYCTGLQGNVERPISGAVVGTVEINLNVGLAEVCMRAGHHTGRPTRCPQGCLREVDHPIRQR